MDRSSSAQHAECVSIGGFLNNLLNILQTLDLRKKLMLGFASISILVTAGLLLRLAFAPDYKLLYAGLDNGTSGEVIAELEQRGITYEVRNGSIFVDQAMRDELRMTLASQGLPKTTVLGYELLDNLSGFSTTSQMFDVAYWRAKEGELSRTIASSPHISNARVHISSPGMQIIGRTEKAKASVFITANQSDISGQHVKALKYLVSSAIRGLDVSDVAVIDAKNGLLGEKENQSLTDSIDNRASALKAKVERLMDAHFGFGNAVVEVSLDIVQDSEAIFEKRFDPKGRVAISTQTVETNNMSNSTDQAVVGVASNVPDKSGSESGKSESKNSEVKETVNYEVSEINREILKSPGEIRRMSVAVLINSASINSDQTTLDENILKDIETLVSSAVGFDAERGDNITIKAMNFAPLATPNNPLHEPILNFSGIDTMRLVQLAVLAVIFTILSLFVVRPLLFRKPSQESLPVIAKPNTHVSSGVETVANNELPQKLSLRTENEQLNLQKEPTERLRHLIGDKQDETIELLRSWLEEERKPT